MMRGLKVCIEDRDTSCNVLKKQYIILPFPTKQRIDDMKAISKKLCMNFIQYRIFVGNI
jgi:hypothetical protein